MFLSLSGIKRGKFISVYNSIVCSVCKTAYLEVQSYGVSDTKLRSHLSNNIYLSHNF